MKKSIASILCVLSFVAFSAPTVSYQTATNIAKKVIDQKVTKQFVENLGIEEDIVQATNRLNQTLTDALDAKRDKSDLAVYSVTRTENTDWTWTSDNAELAAALNEASVKPIYDSENHFWVITGTTHWGEFYYNSPGVYDVDALSVRLAFITIPGYVDYYATATRPRYMDKETLGPAKPNQQLAAVATDDASKPADGSLMKYDAANDRFVKATAGTDYATKTELASAISTNNPAFVSAVQNTPTENIPEDMPTDWGTYGTVGAALAALAAFVKWAKAKIVAVIGDDGKPTDQFAADLLGKQVANANVRYALATASSATMADRTVNILTMTQSETLTFPTATTHDGTTYARDFLLKLTYSGGTLQMPTGLTKVGDELSFEAGKTYLIAFTEIESDKFYVRSIDITEAQA